MLSFTEIEELFPMLSIVPTELLLVLVIALALWSTIIKGFALWHAARNAQSFWFVLLLVINTMGILELIYLFAFRKDKQPNATVASTVPTA